MAKSTRDNTKKRPPVTGTLVGVRLQPDDLRALDVWRRHQDSMPSRPEAIRQLLATVLGKAKGDKGVRF